MDPEMVQ